MEERVVLLAPWCCSTWRCEQTRAMRRLIAALITVAFLHIFVAPASAQPTPLTFDDGKVLLKGTLAMSQDSAGRVFVMKDNAAQMPAFDPMAYYEGNDKSGHPVVWMNSNPAGTYVGKTFMSMAGDAFAAMDHGYAGAEWKARYDSATAADKTLPAETPDPFTNRHALLAQLDAIWEARSIAYAQSAKDNLVWVTRTLKPGMKRSVVYAALRERRLVAYNEAYDPGTPIDAFGCDRSHSTQGNWPIMNQPVPHRIGPCASLGQAEQKKSPEAFISWQGGFTIACSTRTTIELDFDDADDLIPLKKPETYQGCL